MAIEPEVAKFQLALETKEDKISFLRGHVSQLTRSISQLFLKPGEEEIKKRARILDVRVFKDLFMRSLTILRPSEFLIYLATKAYDSEMA